MSDFEIESDDEDSSFNRRSKTNPYSHKEPFLSKSRAQKSFFGGNSGAHDKTVDDEYNYDFDQIDVPKTKSSSKASSSKQPESGRNVNTPSRNSNATSESALEKAQNMLNKYAKSNNSTSVDDVNKNSKRNGFSLKKPSESFDENDISIDSNDDSHIGLSASRKIGRKGSFDDSKTLYGSPLLGSFNKDEDELHDGLRSIGRLDSVDQMNIHQKLYDFNARDDDENSIEQPKVSIPDKKKRPSTSPLKQKSKAPPPVVVIADSTSARVSSSVMHSAGRVALRSSALDMSTGSAVSTDPGGDDDDEDEEEIEESQSQAALDATGASQVSVPDDTEYDEVFEESTIKIEKWEDEEDDDREDEDEDEEEDYSRENDDKWEDDEDDVVDDLKGNVKQSGMERPVKYEEPDRPKFASFADLGAITGWAEDNSEADIVTPLVSRSPEPSSTFKTISKDEENEDEEDFEDSYTENSQDKDERTHRTDKSNQSISPPPATIRSLEGSGIKKDPPVEIMKISPKHTATQQVVLSIPVPLPVPVPVPLPVSVPATSNTQQSPLVISEKPKQTEHSFEPGTWPVSQSHPNPFSDPVLGPVSNPLSAPLRQSDSATTRPAPEVTIQASAPAIHTPVSLSPVSFGGLQSRDYGPLVPPVYSPEPVQSQPLAHSQHPTQSPQHLPTQQFQPQHTVSPKLQPQYQPQSQPYPPSYLPQPMDSAHLSASVGQHPTFRAQGLGQGQGQGQGLSPPYQHPIYSPNAPLHPQHPLMASSAFPYTPPGHVPDHLMNNPYYYPYVPSPYSANPYASMQHPLQPYTTAQSHSDMYQSLPSQSFHHALHHPHSHLHPQHTPSPTSGQGVGLSGLGFGLFSSARSLSVNPVLSGMQGLGFNATNRNNVSSPAVEDLLRDLKEAKEDAVWAKARLSEMISLLNDSNTREEGRASGGFRGSPVPLQGSGQGPDGGQRQGSGVGNGRKSTGGGGGVGSGHGSNQGPKQRHGVGEESESLGSSGDGGRGSESDSNGSYEEDSTESQDREVDEEDDTETAAAEAEEVDDDDNEYSSDFEDSPYKTEAGISSEKSKVPNARSTQNVRYKSSQNGDSVSTSGKNDNYNIKSTPKKSNKNNGNSNSKHRIGKNNVSIKSNSSSRRSRKSDNVGESSSDIHIQSPSHNHNHNHNSSHSSADRNHNDNTHSEHNHTNSQQYRSKTTDNDSNSNSNSNSRYNTNNNTPSKSENKNMDSNSAYQSPNSSGAAVSALFDLSSPLLTSQALFRHQLNNLRERMNLTTNTRPSPTPTPGPWTVHHTLSPSLQEVKQQFEENTRTQSMKLWQVIRQVDSSLGEVEAKKLAEKYTVIQ